MNDGENRKRGTNMTYETCIRDELGYIVIWTVGMSDDEVQDILEQHPEWCLSVEVS